MSRLKDLYEKQIRDALKKEFGYKNEMEIPRLEKIVLNIGVNLDLNLNNRPLNLLNP